MIKNLNEAFDIIKNIKQGIPFEAIKYIRNYPQNELILNEIIFSLNKAYNKDVYSAEKNEGYCPEPLWYGIIAENYIEKEIINPVINLFIQDEEDWYLLDEQGQYLIGLLAEKYPDIVPEKALSIIEKELGKDTSHVYLFLFDALYYLDIPKNKKRLLSILQDKNLFWLESYVKHLADLQIKEAIPILEMKLEEIKTGSQIKRLFSTDIEEAIKQLATGINEYPELSMPYSKQRADWETHYKELEKDFYCYEKQKTKADRNVPVYL